MTDNRTQSSRHQPELTVGQGAGDLRGDDDKVIQAAADYLHRFGGGVLRILPGEYVMRNALYLHSDLTVRGCGEQTVLKKAPSVSAPLAQDADWYETQVAVTGEDVGGFTVGGGVMLQSWKGEPGQKPALLEVATATIVGIRDNALLLHKRHDKNFWLRENAVAATLFALIDGHGVNDVRIADLVLDGNMEHNDHINGNYAAAMFCQDCDRFTIEGVTARNYNGDGFSFQRCDDFHFERCVAADNRDLGFHPGSGNQRPTLRDCSARGNDQGIFFCWGVTDGVVENCTCADNRSYGISIGHRDTDNRIARCRIERNGKVGIFFRAEDGPFWGGHRNVIDDNDIADNGSEEGGVGIEVGGETHDVRIINNRIVDSGGGRQREGVRSSAKARRTVLEGNRFEGLERDVVEE